MFQLFTDFIHRVAYATDASAYREVPQGVAYPECEDDIVELVRVAKERGTFLIPRAGGTSIAGQVVGSGIVVDVSKFMNRIVEINPAERYAVVQPGVVLDELNLACREYGLFFSPETSTSNRCCIGGMFGNNSCGSHSLVYGSTRDHVVEARGVLSNGEVVTFKEEREGTSGRSPFVQSIYDQLSGFASDKDTCSLIADNYPDRSLKRRSCGYAIDEVIEGLQDDGKPLEDRTINLCKLLAGSEGTLAFITEIKVSLDPLPPKEQMVVCAHCDTLQKSFRANLVALRHNPAAVELMDSNVLQLSKDNPEQSRNRTFVNGDPAAILIVELRGESREEIDYKADALESDLMKGGDSKELVYRCTRVYGAETAKVWNLRKSALGLLSGMKGDAKPVGVIEDTAVIPQRLPEYMDDFGKMLAKYGLSCVYHAHIGTGELHLRPVLNLKTEHDRLLFRKVAVETALLVKKYRGSLSGEHGDGRLRGEFIPLMYGEKVYQLMRDVKKCWDPDGVFNMGKIVDTAPMDTFLRYDADQQYAVERELEGEKGYKSTTYFNWKAAFDECRIAGATGAKSQLHAMMCSIEQCNGAGDCRKSNLFGGTLCPAYKVSGDELLSTRSRANILREILTHGWDSPAFGKSANGFSSAGGGNNRSIFSSPEIAAMLDSCLACKGCRSECPSNVDMTRIRAEILQHRHDVSGTPFRSYMVARMAEIERLGRSVRPLYNVFAKWDLSSEIIKKIIGFSAEREIPALSRCSMRALVRHENHKKCSAQHGSHVASKGKVYLFADEFTDCQEAELGLTFYRLLVRLGYEVEIPKHVESGRAAISKGCLKLARKFAVKNVTLLQNVISENTPLVGIEPSCILSFRDEYPDLVDPQMREKAKNLALNCLLYDEFLMREVEKGNITASEFKDDIAEVWLHGHCHQKSLVGIEKTADILRLPKGLKINVIPSGCCGMAGSFGYEKEHYGTSLEIGEMVLFPAVRKAVNADDGTTPVFVAAPGTSCRQQISDGTGVHAVHPIEILYKWLKIK
ncbi:MAG: FAD-linked oxidase C-terminal domain-containing protein [Bacteroidales bacterium]|nr:FAD-linked oxidase C-terminal domain-containing protein [Bacteroidales bacterium]MDD4670887.1 FAD-linked oxidase C-terminal domain-containing protein [Bacteroidales bacterium]